MTLLRPLRTVGDERLAVGALPVVARHRARHLEVGAVLLDDELHHGGLLRRLGAIGRLLRVATLVGGELALRGVERPCAPELRLGLRAQRADGKNEHGRHEADRTFCTRHAILL